MSGMDVRRIVGLNIRKHRIASALSQEELASRMGVEQFYISGLEAGRRNPTLVTLWRAADALGITPTKLLDERGQRVELPAKKRAKKKAPSR
ncbi:helix-turn-helix domain-containing protein [Bradyrhizobium sp.]|uniref:helix-turn-helix domain-containing protein n=1 Tax=Bradyrhizobium sp. TaxID=376 RepID=UPI003C72275C